MSSKKSQKLPLPSGINAMSGLGLGLGSPLDSASATTSSPLAAAAADISLTRPIGDKPRLNQLKPLSSSTNTTVNSELHHHHHQGLDEVINHGRNMHPPGPSGRFGSSTFDFSPSNGGGGGLNSSLGVNSSIGGQSQFNQSLASRLNREQTGGSGGGEAVTSAAITKPVTTATTHTTAHAAHPGVATGGGGGRPNHPSRLPPNQHNNVKLASILPPSLSGSEKSGPVMTSKGGQATDPFSTPARRRRIVAEFARTFLKHTCITACDNVALFRKRSKASIKIQSIVRIFFAVRERLRLRYIRQTKAAIIIQSIYRMRRAIKLRAKLFKIWKLKVTTNLANLLQARRKVSMKRKYRRAFVKRRRWEVKLMKERSALMIQSAYRMHKKRKYYIRKILRDHRAALKVTSAVRIFIARRKVSRLRAVYLLMNTRIRLWWWRFKRVKLARKWLTNVSILDYLSLLHRKFEYLKIQREIYRENARKQKLLQEEKEAALKAMPPKIVIERINTSKRSSATVSCGNDFLVRHFIDLAVLRRLMTLGTYDTIHYLLDLGLIYFHNSSNSMRLNGQNADNIYINNNDNNNTSSNDSNNKNGSRKGNQEEKEEGCFCGFSLGAVFHRVIFNVNNLLLAGAPANTCENDDHAAVSSSGIGVGLDATHFETLFPYMSKEHLQLSRRKERDDMFANGSNQSQIIRDSIDNQGNRSVIVTDTPFSSKNISSSISGNNSSRAEESNPLNDKKTTATTINNNSNNQHFPSGPMSNVPANVHDDAAMTTAHISSNNSSSARPMTGRRGYKRPASGVAASSGAGGGGSGGGVNFSIEHFNSMFRREEYDQYRFPDKAIFMSNDNYEKFMEFFDEDYASEDQGKPKTSRESKGKDHLKEEEEKEEDLLIKKKRKKMYEDTLESLIPLRWSQVISRKTPFSYQQRRHGEGHLVSGDNVPTGEAPLDLNTSTQSGNVEWDISLQRNNNSIEVFIQFFEHSVASSTTVDESSVSLTLSDIVHGYDGKDSFMKRMAGVQNNSLLGFETQRMLGMDVPEMGYESMDFTTEFPPGKSTFLPGDVVKRIHTHADVKSTRRIISSFKLLLESDKSDSELFVNDPEKGYVQPAQGMITPWPKFDKKESTLRFMYRDILVIVGGSMTDQKNEKELERKVSMNKLPAENVDIIEDIDIGELNDFDKDYTNDLNRNSNDEYKRDSGKSRATSGIGTRPTTATLRIVSDEELFKKMEIDDITLVQSLARMKLAKKHVRCMKIQRCVRRYKAFARFKWLAINVLLIAQQASLVLQRFFRTFLSVRRVDRLRNVLNLELKRQIEQSCDNVMYAQFERSLTENISAIAKHRSKLDKKMNKKPLATKSNSSLQSIDITMSSFISAQTLTFKDTIKFPLPPFPPLSPPHNSATATAAASSKANAEHKSSGLNFDNKAILSEIGKSVDGLVTSLLASGSETFYNAGPKLDEEEVSPLLDSSSNHSQSYSQRYCSSIADFPNPNTNFISKSSSFDNSFESKIEFAKYSGSSLGRLESLNSKYLCNNLDPEYAIKSSSSGVKPRIANKSMSDVVGFDLKMLSVLNLDSFGGSHIASSISNSLDKSFFRGIITPTYQLTAKLPVDPNKKRLKKTKKKKLQNSKKMLGDKEGNSEDAVISKEISNAIVANKKGGKQANPDKSENLSDEDLYNEEYAESGDDEDDGDEEDSDNEVPNMFIQQALEKFEHEKLEKEKEMNPELFPDENEMKSFAILSHQEKAREYMQLYSIMKSDINYERLVEKIDKEKESRKAALKETIAKESAKFVNKRFHNNKSFDVFLPAGFDENGSYYDPIGLIKVQKELSGLFLQSPKKPKEEDDFIPSDRTFVQSGDRLEFLDIVDTVDSSSSSSINNNVEINANLLYFKGKLETNLSEADLAMVSEHKVVDVLMFPEYLRRNEFTHS